MSRTARRTLQIVTAALMVAAWGAYYVFTVTTSEPPAPPETNAKVNREFALMLLVPTALYVVAALLLLHRWLIGAATHLSRMDSPGQLLAVAVATLPDHRRDWGAAMTAELAGIEDRSDRWRFALSCTVAALRLPPLSGWLVLALVSGGAVAAVAVVGPAVGAVVPGLRVFAVWFVGLVGCAVVLSVARSRRLRLPVPIPTVVVILGVAAAIAMTVVFLRHDPTAARYLSPAEAVFLAAVLAGCLHIAVASPRSLGTSRLAPHLGVGVAVAFVVAFLLLMWASQSTDLGPQARQAIEDLTLMLILLGPSALCVASAVAAGLARSFRAGLQSGVWLLITALPFAYANWLYGSLHMYEINGGALFWGDGVPEGENLADALSWVLRFGPVVGIPCIVISAALAAYVRPARPQPVPGPVNP